ncbi:MULTISPECIES: hypothetical protein [Mycolicibacterium]|uniref:hypothetical protein n=1 Tax=Mycolicibacterium TaxID=1866885 RepID=UPI001CDC09CA|nr:hypothetical protein [Mycolicibacterium fortuitum]UBV20397.1 hypothetical protein H8Z59_24495 [Mycolicibacterium fortuitum]
MSASQHERRALCETAAVTLDGAPARISGSSLPFAKVSRKDGRGGEVEFAWDTVALIVTNGGKFQS